MYCQVFESSHIFCWINCMIVFCLTPMGTMGDGRSTSFWAIKPLPQKRSAKKHFLCPAMCITFPHLIAVVNIPTSDHVQMSVFIDGLIEKNIQDKYFLSRQKYSRSHKKYWEEMQKYIKCQVQAIKTLEDKSEIKFCFLVFPPWYLCLWVIGYNFSADL